MIRKLIEFQYTHPWKTKGLLYFVLEVAPDMICYIHLLFTYTVYC